MRVKLYPPMSPLTQCICRPPARCQVILLTKNYPFQTFHRLVRVTASLFLVARLHQLQAMHTITRCDHKLVHKLRGGERSVANLTTGVSVQPALMCAGHGMCDFYSGDCACYPGYKGVDCSICADGFFMTGHGFCQPKLDTSTCKPDSKTTPPPETSTPPSPPNDDGPKITYGVKFGPWSKCTQECGGGVQTRDWGCYDASTGYKAGT